MGSHGRLREPRELTRGHGSYGGPREPREATGGHGKRREATGRYGSHGGPQKAKRCHGRPREVTEGFGCYKITKNTPILPLCYPRGAPPGGDPPPTYAFVVATVEIAFGCACPLCCFYRFAILWHCSSELARYCCSHTSSLALSSLPVP